MQLSGHKILLLSAWYYPDSVGGTETYVHSLGKELVSQGLNITIAAPSIDEKEHEYIHGGLPVYRYPISLKPTKPEIRGDARPSYFDIFAKWLDKNRPDIAHLHSFTRGCGFFHAEYIKKLGIPLIFTAHVPGITCVRGTMMRWGKIPCDGEMRAYRCAACYLHKRTLVKLVGIFQMKRLIIKRTRQVQRLFSLSDHIVALSQWLYEAFRISGVPASKLSLCRHGLPPEAIVHKKNINKKKRPIQIGYIGRFSPVKGAHVLIEAVKRIPLTTSIELCIYGRANDNEERIYFKKLNRIANTDSRIHFCGEITNQNRQQVFDGLDIIAVPSLWLETGPLVVLEARAAGIPVIGSNLGGIAELVTNGVNGLLIKTGNIKAWKETLAHLCSNPSSLKSFCRNITPVPASKSVAESMHRVYEEFYR